LHLAAPSHIQNCCSIALALALNKSLRYDFLLEPDRHSGSILIPMMVDLLNSEALWNGFFLPGRGIRKKASFLHSVNVILGRMGELI
jgi:hypothetical protein